MDELVILVDEKDNELAYGEKHAVHKAGKLHRCFSIFIFDSHGKMLIQQRAMKKYHSPGLWTNTCCGHPRPKENTKKAAHRRMGEEMGFDCKFEEAFTASGTSVLERFRFISRSFAGSEMNFSIAAASELSNSGLSSRRRAPPGPASVSALSFWCPAAALGSGTRIEGFER